MLQAATALRASDPDRLILIRKEPGEFVSAKEKGEIIVSEMPAVISLFTLSAQVISSPRLQTFFEP